MKKFQLVVQWSASTMEDYDDVVEIENELIEKLDPKFEVDGHDMGSGQVNIFVHIDQPIEAFPEIKRILSDAGHLDGARIAYRAFDGSKYTILWPTTLSNFDVF